MDMCGLSDLMFGRLGLQILNNRTMKKLILITIAGLLTSFSHAQIKASEVFDQLKKMPDQFDDAYDPTEIKDQLTLIYIPGSNNPFQKIYMKQKAAYLKDNVLLVGGFKEMMGMMSIESKKDHLQEALALQYKKGSTILIDMDSELGQLLNINGYSIITISKDKNEVLSIEDFGFDRVEFFKKLKEYEIQQNDNAND